MSIASPFRRVLVSHVFHGVTRVWWELQREFHYPHPHTFQLQASYSGADNANDWVNLGPPALEAAYLDDESIREPTGKRLLTHYRVVLTTPSHKFVSPATPIWGLLSTRDWNLAREIIRKEQLRSSQIAGAPGYLLRRLRYGKASTENTDFLTGEVIDTSHKSSWGTAIESGYHPPYPLELDMSPETINELRGGGDVSRHNSDDRIITARMTVLADISKEDVWITGHTDQRWAVHSIKTEAHYRGVPLIRSLELRLLPFNDLVYQLPVSPLAADPADTEDYQPLSGSGCVRVDHDYGENEALTYLNSECCGISGATVEAFTKADWDAGLRSAQYVKATAHTGANGQWTWAMQLLPGTYVLRYEKLGHYGPDTQELVVTAESAAASQSSLSESLGPPPPPPSDSFSSSFGLF